MKNKTILYLTIIIMIGLASAEIPTVTIPLPSSSTSSIIVINGSAIGTCPNGYAVQNVTATTIQCILMTGGSGGDTWTGNYSNYYNKSTEDFNITTKYNANYSFGTNNFNGNGNFSTTGNITARRFVSTISTGQPYQCTSTTLNTNLNADLLDGYHYNGLPYISTESDPIYSANVFAVNMNQYVNTTSNVWFDVERDFGKETIGNISAYPSSITDGSSTYNYMGYYNSRPYWDNGNGKDIWFFDGNGMWYLGPLADTGTCGMGNDVYNSYALIGTYIGIGGAICGYYSFTSVVGDTGKLSGGIRDSYNYYNNAYLFTVVNYTCNENCATAQKAYFYFDKFPDNSQLSRIVSLTCVGTPCNVFMGGCGSWTKACYASIVPQINSITIINPNPTPGDTPGAWVAGDNFQVMIGYTQ